MYIDKMVYQVLDEFYDVSMKKHIALDYPTVVAKIDRLEKAMYDFADKAAMVVHAEPYRRKTLGIWNYIRKGFILRIKFMPCQTENVFCTITMQCMTS